MLTKSITYTDYNGNERTEEFYFHLSEAELVEMQFSEVGGLEKYIEKISKTNDQKKLIEMFKDIILKSYGEVSLDGKRFEKSAEMANAFSQTEAYSKLFMELAFDDEAAAAFITGIVPASVREKATTEQSGGLPFQPKDHLTKKHDNE